MSIKDLKSYILKKTDSMPFIFKFDIENDRKVSDLIELQRKYYSANKPVRKPVKQVSRDDPKKWVDYSIANELDVITDFEHFDISFEYDNGLTQVKSK
jgi:ribosomal protein S8